MIPREDPAHSTTSYSVLHAKYVPYSITRKVYAGLAMFCITVLVFVLMYDSSTLFSAPTRVYNQLTEQQFMSRYLAADRPFTFKLDQFTTSNFTDFYVIQALNSKTWTMVRKNPLPLPLPFPLPRIDRALRMYDTSSTTLRNNGVLPFLPGSTTYSSLIDFARETHITREPYICDAGFDVQVSGTTRIELESVLTNKRLRFVMNPGDAVFYYPGWRVTKYTTSKVSWSVHTNVHIPDYSGSIHHRKLQNIANSSSTPLGMVLRACFRERSIPYNHWTTPL